MSLRRTALARRTPLQRTSSLARTGWVRKVREHRTRSTKSRPTDTGPSKAQRRMVAERANYCCEICGRSLWLQGEGWTAVHSFHHRQPRQMGGSSRPEINSPANLLLLCGSATTGCHLVVEDDRIQALGHGWLVIQEADPARIRVVVALRREPVYLTHDGEYAEAGAAA